MSIRTLFMIRSLLAALALLATSASAEVSVLCARATQGFEAIDEPAIYRQAAHAPGDWGPLLVLADWYDDAGQPERAAAIRFAARRAGASIEYPRTILPAAGGAIGLAPLPITVQWYEPHVVVPDGQGGPGRVVTVPPPRIPAPDLPMLALDLTGPPWFLRPNRTTLPPSRICEFARI